jgi:hypothetical protein
MASMHCSFPVLQRRCLNLGKRRYGLVQLSCALLLERNESPERFGFGQTAPNADQIAERKATFENWFAPPASTFQLKALWEEASVSSVGSPLSWLDSLSRHDLYEMALYKGYESADSGREIPPLFVGAKIPANKGVHKPAARIPVQRPQGRRSYPLPVDKLDHNDFMVTGNICETAAPSGALADARRFLVFLFALRRSAIFTSNLRERIYNIWLPSAVLTPANGPNTGAGKLAIFPFVGLTRRPSSQAWRFVFTFNVVIAPTNSDGGETNRKFTDAEVGALVGCLDGPSTNPASREWNLPSYEVVGDTWRCYADDLLKHDPPSSLRAPTHLSSGTLRNWLELLFFSVARRQLVGSADGKREDLGDEYLADEVLRSIRTMSCWSVLLDASPRFKPASQADSSPSDSQSWSPRAGLPSLMTCFDHLAIGPARWFRPTDEDRVDHGRVGERTWMAWALPIRRCIVTFYFSRAENFPLRSRLNLFTVFGHMAAGLMTTREILVKLGHDMELHRESQAAAELHRKYIIELEEMFDLDIAWAFYRRIYQRLRKLRGLDDMYRNVRERMELLGEYYATLDEIKAETMRTRLAIAAAILAAAIIGLGVWALLGQVPGAQVWQPILFVAITVFVAVMWGGWGRWKKARKYLSERMSNIVK